MRRQSQKFVQRMKESAGIRRQLIQEAGKCMGCGSRYKRLACHEILCGPLRQKTLDEPCSLLVLCWECNSGPFHDKSLWPVARQLALLLKHSPDRYDLELFNWLRNPAAPRFVEQPEVDAYLETV